MKEMKNAKEISDPEKGSLKEAIKQGRYKEITDLREKDNKKR